MTGRLLLAEGWRKADITWRPSAQRWLAFARLFGPDLTAAEKEPLGIAAKQLAFRQKESVPSQARAAGIRPGDIIVGIDDMVLETDASGFLDYLRRYYLVGDTVTVNLFRDGKRLNLSMPLLR